MLRLVLPCLLVHSLWWGCGKKRAVLVHLPHTVFISSTVRSQLGPNDCVDTVSISENPLASCVPPGTVCIQCRVGGEVANDTVFQIDGSNINESIGRVVDGVLVVFDSESVFNASVSSATYVQCINVHLNASHSVKMCLESKSQFIIIENHTQLGVIPLLCIVLDLSCAFTF